MVRPVDEFITDPTELIDAGDQQVVLYLRYRGRAKGSGIRVPAEYFAIVIDIRDAKMRAHGSTPPAGEALSAVRLSE